MRHAVEHDLRYRALAAADGTAMWKTLDEALAFGEYVEPMKSDVAGILHDLRKQGKRVLFEGAQGALLDIDHGTYPYVTSSNTTVGAALAGTGVGNALVEIEGPEVPILDGSALQFVQLLDRAGFRRQEAPQTFIEILKPIRVEEGDKSAVLKPCDRCEMRFEIDFPTPVIGNQVVDFVVDEATFRSDIMAARTFGFAHEVEALRQAGLARGGSLENAVVIDGDQILNPGGLRMEREFVRHKALDAIGESDRMTLRFRKPYAAD